MSIRGAFPGGPTRTGSGRGLLVGRDLATAEQMEAAVARCAARRASSRRRARGAVGMAAMLGAALLAGGILGWASHTTREDLIAPPSPTSSLDRLISSEVNRTLLELWKMENVEAMGRTGGFR